MLTRIATASFVTLSLCPTLAAVPDAVDGLRSAIVCPGDIDDDGLRDVVVCSRPPKNVLALSGKDGGLLWSRSGAPGFGRASAVVGDLDGDGVSEIALAGPAFRGGRWVEVVSGASGEALFRVPRPKGVESIGRALSGGMDATGDGVPDFLIGGSDVVLLVDGARREIVAYVLAEDRDDAGGQDIAEAPRRFPVERAKGAKARPRVMRAAQLDTLTGDVLLVPDLDGDGRAEIAAGSGEEGERPYGTHVLFSASESRRLTLPSAGWCLEVLPDVDGDGVVELATSMESTYVRVFELGRGQLLWQRAYHGYNMNGEGTSLCALPDLNDDGAPELAHGANETGLDCDVGFVAIHDGRTGKYLDKRESDKVDEDLNRVAWDNWCKSGLDVCAVSTVVGLRSARIAVFSSKLAEVRMLRAQGGLSILWRVDLDGLLSAPWENREER